MPRQGSSPSRSLPLLGLAIGLMVAAVVWLADPFAPTASFGPDGAPDTSTAPPTTAAASPDAHSTTTANATADRHQQPVAGSRARMTGRVFLGDSPLPGAAVRLAGDSATTATTTTTAADGTFALDVVPGRHQLAIAGVGTPRNTTWGPVVLAPGQTFALGDVVVPLPASVRGRVVDEHGAPIVDALVVTGLGGAAWAANATDLAALGSPPHAVSDADGRFRIAGLCPHQGSLQVERAGHQYGWRQYTLAAGQELDLGLVVLNIRQPLHGVVFGPNGAPLAGARVVAGGTRNDPLRQRSAVTTDARGMFVLDPRSGNDVTVFADGCEPRTVTHEGEAALHLTLSAAHELRGIVAGSQGRLGELRIDRVPGDYAERPQWVNDILTRTVPIAADGAFLVPCLPAGPWQLAANVPLVGRSALVVVTVPSAEPVRLELLAQRTVRLVAQDDLGAPVPDVLITASMKLPGAGEFQIHRVTLPLDRDGATRLDVPTGCEPTLACSSPSHAPWQRALAPGESEVTIVLPRLGAVAGALGSTDYSAHCRLVVQAKSEKGAHVASVDADRVGRYRLALAAGDYRIDLIAVDSSHFADYDVPVATSIPLVTEFESLGASVPVTVRNGETTVVDLAVPTFAEITGRVLVRGQPLAGAIVYASSARDRDRTVHAGPDRHEYFPHQRTDAAGMFRFLVSSGREVQLQARHGRSGEWSPPLAVTVGNGERRHVDLALHAAAIRGRIDLATMSLQQRQFVEARLCPVAEADEDDTGFFLSSLPPHHSQPKCPLGPDGAFAFECLPPGGYVLRIGNTFEAPLVQRIVYTSGDEAHELGLLAIQTEHPVKLAADPPTKGHRTVLAVLPTPGNELGVFAGSGDLHEGRLDLGTLPAGSYRLLLLAADHGGTFGTPRPEASAEITVGSDGTVTPARVTFAAKK